MVSKYRLLTQQLYGLHEIFFIRGTFIRDTSSAWLKRGWARVFRGDRGAGQDHDPNVPKGLGVGMLLEFLLYLIRKWSPDAHGAQTDVGGSVGRSGL